MDIPGTRLSDSEIFTPRRSSRMTLLSTLSIDNGRLKLSRSLRVALVTTSGMSTGEAAGFSSCARAPETLAASAQPETIHASAVRFFFTCMVRFLFYGRKIIAEQIDVGIGERLGGRGHLAVHVETRLRL